MEQLTKAGTVVGKSPCWWRMVREKKNVLCHLKRNYVQLIYFFSITELLQRDI